MAPTRRRAGLIVLGAVVYGLVVVGSMSANFVPSGVKGWIVVLTSSVLGVLLPIALRRGRVARLSASNRRWLYFYTWLFGALIFAPLVGVALPVATSFVYATPIERELTVARTRSSTFRRWHCNGVVLLEYEDLMDNTICVSSALWDSLRPGAKLRVTAMENGLGFRILEVRPSQ
jgi:hypothetical protein